MTGLIEKFGGETNGQISDPVPRAFAGMGGGRKRLLQRRRVGLRVSRKAYRNLVERHRVHRIGSSGGAARRLRVHRGWPGMRSQFGLSLDGQHGGLRRSRQDVYQGLRRYAVWYLCCSRVSDQEASRSGAGAGDCRLSLRQPFFHSAKSGKISRSRRDQTSLCWFAFGSVGAAGRSESSGCKPLWGACPTSWNN